MQKKLPIFSFLSVKNVTGGLKEHDAYARKKILGICYGFVKQKDKTYTI